MQGGSHQAQLVRWEPNAWGESTRGIKICARILQSPLILTSTTYARRGRIRMPRQHRRGNSGDESLIEVVATKVSDEPSAHPLVTMRSPPKTQGPPYYTRPLDAAASCRACSRSCASHSNTAEPRSSLWRKLERAKTPEHTRSASTDSPAPCAKAHRQEAALAEPLAPAWWRCRRPRQFLTHPLRGRPRRFAVRNGQRQRHGKELTSHLWATAPARTDTRPCCDCSASATAQAPSTQVRTPLSPAECPGPPPTLVEDPLPQIPLPATYARSTCTHVSPCLCLYTHRQVRDIAR